MKFEFKSKNYYYINKISISPLLYRSLIVTAVDAVSLLEEGNSNAINWSASAWWNPKAVWKKAIDQNYGGLVLLAVDIRTTLFILLFYKQHVFNEV